MAAMPPRLRELTRELCEPAFLGFLERVTGIDGLVPDPYLEGGGLHGGGPGATLTPHTVPDAINVLAVGVSATCCVMAFCAHLFERVNAKLDLMFQVLAARLDELEGRVGDRNSGFVEGYLLRHTPDASVVPLAPRIARRGAGEG